MYGTYGRYTYPNQNESSGGAGYAYLLDDYTGGTMAWSVRLLRSAYTGALVRIRRSSDNAEKDFYPDANNVLSMTSEDGAGTSLSTWISTDSGYIVTWYGQGSGAVNITNAAANQQARIVNAGSLEVIGSMAAPNFKWDGSNNSFYTGTSATLNQAFTVFSNIQFDASTGTTQDFLNWDNAATRRPHFWADVPDVGINMGSQVLLSASPSYGTHYLIYGLLNSTGSEVGLNGGTAATGDAGTNNNGTTIGVGARTAGGRGCDGRIQEIVMFSGDKSSDRTGIESNINSAFSIY